MARIIDIKAREILDSRGTPTIETVIFLDNGIFTGASVPSGASTGKHEAFELRDSDKARYKGKGVLKAIDNIQNKILPLIKDIDVTKQKDIDAKMIEADATPNKSNFGANSILSVSLACARGASLSLQMPLYKYINLLSHSGKPRLNRGASRIPGGSWTSQDDSTAVTPMFNIINGGLHGSGNLSFQEFLLIPDKSKSYSQSLQMGAELYQEIKTYLKENKLNYSVGDEGGFTPNLRDNEKVLDLLREIIDSSKYKYGVDVHLGLDLAASQYYKISCYHVLKHDNKGFDSHTYIDYLEKLQKEYSLFSLEDPLAEDDWDSWIALTAKIGDKTKIIGDDLLVTNRERLNKAIKLQAANSVLIKVNQIGTLTETLEVIRRAKEANFTVIISHRSGETNDDFIADLAVGVSADLVKFGAPARGERVAKYNRLGQIYEELRI